MNRALEVFDGIIVRILVAMLALAIIAVTANLVWVFVTDLASTPFDFLTVAELLDVFGTFLVVLIGLELLETVKDYTTTRHVQVEAVLLVALIALLRKVITLDVKDLAAPTLFAVAALILALAASYWLMRRALRGKTGSAEPSARGL
jgi:uncharacterized membrane protein (DUF373 family)